MRVSNPSRIQSSLMPRFHLASDSIVNCQWATVHSSRCRFNKFDRRSISWTGPLDLTVAPLEFWRRSANQPAASAGEESRNSTWRPLVLVRTSVVTALVALLANYSNCCCWRRRAGLFFYHHSRRSVGLCVF